MFFRTVRQLGVIRCQHCGREFLVTICRGWRETKIKGIREPILDLIDSWEYLDPPFHRHEDGNTCIGNTMLSISQWEWQRFGYERTSELCYSLALPDEPLFSDKGREEGDA
jgi:hypothetical protein